MSYDTSTVVQSRVRPGNQQVELSLALNADGPNFDVSKGEQGCNSIDILRVMGANLGNVLGRLLYY